MIFQKSLFYALLCFWRPQAPLRVPGARLPMSQSLRASALPARLGFRLSGFRRGFRLDFYLISIWLDF